MKEVLLQLLIFAYATVGIINLIAFWPTIHDLYKKKPSANIPSYWLWTTASSIAFLYTLFILDDTLVRIVSGSNLLACVIVLVLSIKLKYCKRK